jgi:uncharacterized protein (DUF58 family)
MEAAYRQFLLDGERAGSRFALGVPRRVPQGRAGLHQGGRAGSSLEFKEHRDYQAGDDLRHIDWNAYARSDQLAVKVFHEEINPHLDLLLDGSRSMALADSAKARAALGLAAFFVSAAGNAGFSHRLWLARAGCDAILGGSDRPALWEDIDFIHAGNPAEAMRHRPPAWRPRGFRLLISDLLWVGEPLDVLGPCADRATSVVVVQILAQADANPPRSGNLRLLDVETGEARDLRVDGNSLKRYRAALERHQQNWHNACRQVGAVFTSVIAEDIVCTWRLDDLVAAEILKVS